MSISPDQIKFSMMNIVYWLSNSYGITMDDIAQHQCYVESLNITEAQYSYEGYCKWLEDNSSDQTNISDTEYSINNSDDAETETESETDKPIYVATRRDFRKIMNEGIKICPRYSSCVNEECKNFHILPEHLCPHNPRGSYCDHDDCDLIVIKPCRRGRRCNDSECSFRH